MILQTNGALHYRRYHRFVLGLLRVGGTGAVHGRGGERRALRANAAVEKCEEENPEGNVAVHRAGS